jgi:plastocyanin
VLRLSGLATLIVGIAAASPQTGSVTGRLTLLERAGGARNDIGTAVVYLESLDGRRDADRGNVSADATIAMRGRQFMPHTAVIQRGGSVQFPNQDPFSHNVFSNTEPASFDLGLYRRGASRSATFAEHGVYAIYCNIHARMVSYVIAVPGRHVTRADADGRFELPDVPVGAYRLHIWHERAAHLTQEIAVTAAGATLQLSLDARGNVQGAHLNKFGAPYSSTRADRY